MTTGNEANLVRLEAKVDQLTAQVGALVGAQQSMQSLYEHMTPIAAQAMSVGAERLASLEERGYFDFGREAIHVLDTIVAGYTADDVHALADNVVRMLGVLRRVTQPEVLEFAEHAADAAGRAADDEPAGILGILRSTSKDEDVRRGLTIALEVLRQIGRATNRPEPVALTKLSPLLGGHRNLASQPEAAAPTIPEEPPTPAPAPLPEQDDAPAGAVCFTHDGFFQAPEDWTPELAVALAAHLGLGALSKRHWTVIDFARAEHEATGASPNIRRLTTGSGVPIKELYALFPRAPAKMAARIAGIPKPVGCI